MKKSTKKLLYGFAIAGVIVIAINYYYKRRQIEKHTESTAMKLAGQMSGTPVIGAVP